MKSMNNLLKESKTILLQIDRSKFYLELFSQEDLKTNRIRIDTKTGGGRGGAEAGDRDEWGGSCV